MHGKDPTENHCEPVASLVTQTRSEVPRKRRRIGYQLCKTWGTGTTIQHFSLVVLVFQRCSRCDDWEKASWPAHRHKLGGRGSMRGFTGAAWDGSHHCKSGCRRLDAARQAPSTWTRCASKSPPKCCSRPSTWLSMGRPCWQRPDWPSGAQRTHKVRLVKLSQTTFFPDRVLMLTAPRRSKCYS